MSEEMRIAIKSAYEAKMNNLKLQADVFLKEINAKIDLRKNEIYKETVSK